MSYNESNLELFEAINILEDAYNTKERSTNTNRIVIDKDKEKSKSNNNSNMKTENKGFFKEFLSVFKCG